jgi:hypothetical protein
LFRDTPGQARQALPDDTLIYELRGVAATLRKANRSTCHGTPPLNPTLEEWNSPEDSEAFATCDAGGMVVVLFPFPMGPEAKRRPTVV